MKPRRILLIICVFAVLLGALTLTRCGSGVGPGFDANVNGMKF